MLRQTHPQQGILNMARRNACVDALVETLAEHGLAPSEIITGKHVKIRFEIKGHKHQYVTGVSPSDWRAPMKVRADIRRLIRQAG